MRRNEKRRDEVGDIILGEVMGKLRTIESLPNDGILGIAVGIRYK